MDREPPGSPVHDHSVMRAWRRAVQGEAPAIRASERSDLDTKKRPPIRPILFLNAVFINLALRGGEARRWPNNHVEQVS